MTKTSPEAESTVGPIHDLDSGPSYDADEFFENDGVEQGVAVTGKRKTMEFESERKASMWSVRFV